MSPAVRLLLLSSLLPGVAAAAAALLACSGGSEKLSGFTNDAGHSGSGSSSGGGLTGDGAVGHFGDAGSGGPGPGGSDCAQGAEFVYVVDVKGTMYSFDPPTLTFTNVGDVSCAPGSIFSMAVDRSTTAWVLDANGSIVKYDINKKTCTPTSFSKNQHGFQTFGMGFSSNADGGPAETLFVSDSELTKASNGGLAAIDTTALTLGPVAQYSMLAGRRAEMTGTGDGRLYGAFEGSPYVVAQIDKGNANILSVAPQNAISYPPDSSNFAFAFWGGDFWLFVGPGGSTDVFQYQPATNTTTKRKSVSFEIVGAGVSTCAPTTSTAQ